MYKRSATHWHRGIDLYAPTGTPVYAAAAGTVTHASNEWRQGFNNYGRHVVIQEDPDGPWFLYAHLDRALVQPGQQIEEGQQIGTVGTTQFHAADKTKHFSRSRAHLHFEISPTPYPQAAEADRLDPVAWLEQQDDLEPGLLPKPREVYARLEKAPTAGAFLATGAILLGIMWLARENARLEVNGAAG